MTRRVPMTVALIAFVAFVVACSDSASTHSAASSSSAAPAAGSVNATTTTFKPAFVGQGNVFFLSPSRNIGCALSETGARCDIRDRSWSPPPRPAGCDLDFGQGITVVSTSPATFTCAGDTAIVGDDVLDYGSAVSRGDFQCQSEQVAMRCRNVKSNHGFSLSREKFDLS